MPGDNFYGKVMSRGSATGVGTNAGVSVTKSTPGATQALSAAAIQCSGDAAAIVSVESPAGTFLYRKRFSAAFNMSETFPPGCKRGPVAQDLLVKISASTANCEANLDWFSEQAG